MSIFFNDTKCDYYIGQGAGKMLLKEIENAHSSIKIISPYISPNLLDKLVHISNLDIDVQLITMENSENKYEYSRIIRKLLTKHQEVDEKALERRNLLSKRLKMGKNILLALFLIGCISSVFIKIVCILCIILIPIQYLRNRSYIKELKTIEPYSYYFNKSINFRICKSPFIHSKIFIIDDKVAYLGSLNLTKNGTRSNYETRIKIKDYYALKEIRDEFTDLMTSEDISEASIEELINIAY